MAGMYRTCALGMVAIFVLSSIIMVESASGQTIPKPAMPEFTAKYVDNSYTYPPTYGTDPYSGKTIQTGGGFTHYNKTIEISIKNQPFTTYYEDDNLINLYYRVSYKGHFENQCHYYTKNANLDSDYTSIWFGLVWDTWSPEVSLGALSAGDKVDFRVQTQIGYFGLRENRLAPTGYSINYDDLHGEASEWSTIQTFVMTGTPDLTPLPPPSPSPTSNSPMPTINTGSLVEPFPFPLLVGALVIIVVVIASVLFLRRHRKTAIKTS